MNCKSCGTQNEETSKYCINCGQELKAENETNVKHCNNCGTINERENLFCITCGTELTSKNGKKTPEKVRTTKSKKRQKNKKHSDKKSPYRYSNKNLNLKPLLITVGVVIVTIIVASSFDLIFHKYPKNSQYRTEIRSNNPVLEENVINIASKFICSCGSCNEQPLNTCGCPTAIEEREFIRQELQQNKNPDNIVAAVANKYGWLKAEFASQYNVDKSRTWSNNTLVSEQPKSSNNLLRSNTTTRMATLADRNFIISKFRCPCGQCNIDELANCDCQHPRGATEIKKFITNSILPGTKTVDQIIDEVDNKYGGKKI